MQCMGTWLNSMTDPTFIADGLVTLEGNLEGPPLVGTFDQITTDVTAALTSWAVSAQLASLFVESARHPSGLHTVSLIPEICCSS